MTSTRLIIGAGLKKWMPHDLLGPLGGHGHLDHRQGGRVGGEDGLRLEDVVEPREQLLLHGEVLDHGLEHEVAVGEGVEVVGGADPRRDLLGGGLLELAPLDLLGERLLERGHHRVGRLLLAGPQDDVDARLGGHLRDARPHDPRPDDAQLA